MSLNEIKELIKKGNSRGLIPHADNLYLEAIAKTLVLIVEIIEPCDEHD